MIFFNILAARWFLDLGIDRFLPSSLERVLGSFLSVAIVLHRGSVLVPITPVHFRQATRFRFLPARSRQRDRLV